ncbi:MAG: cyclase family protein [Deltaproteobacteria bacterium]|nr:cyclase family protein [Deltaproteobacteria bacterium]
MPVYPGHLKTVVWTHLSHEECQRNLGTGFSYETRGLLLCDHGPTHIDSVSHLSRDPEAESIDQLSLDKCITEALCIDVSDVARKSQFGADKIKAELDKQGQSIQPGDTLLFYTAHYDRYYGQPEYMTDYPGLTREATEYIIDQGVVNFGVDSPSPDMLGDKTYPCHTVCAERQVTHVENLCNLDKLLGQRFTFIALPLKIREGTGSPVRAVAILGQD